MNKRQIKKRYKRINGQNPPKYFTVAQMKKCSTNSTFNNACAIVYYCIENTAKKIANAVGKTVNAFEILRAAKMLGVDLEAEAKREEDEEQELYIKQAQYIAQERTLLGDMGI